MSLEDLATAGSIYGVAPPTQYISDMQVSDTGNITTILTNIGSDVNGATLNVNATDYKQWNWGGSLPVAYMPK